MDFIRDYIDHATGDYLAIEIDSYRGDSLLFEGMMSARLARQKVVPLLAGHTHTCQRNTWEVNPRIRLEFELDVISRFVPGCGEEPAGSRGSRCPP